MNYHETFTRAREIADAAGTLAKAASISAARGLTGAAAIEHAAGLYLAVVDQYAADMIQAATAERQRAKTILKHPAAATNPGLARKLALETGLSADDAIARLKSGKHLGVETEEPDDAADLILGADR